MLANTVFAYAVCVSMNLPTSKPTTFHLNPTTIKFWFFPFPITTYYNPFPRNQVVIIIPRQKINRIFLMKNKYVIPLFNLYIVGCFSVVIFAAHTYNLPVATQFVASRFRSLSPLPPFHRNLRSLPRVMRAASGVCVCV